MPELRQNPATKEWVIIATERASRPEDFVKPVPSKIIEGKRCPFCEGNEGLTPPEIISYRSYGSYPNSPGWWIRVIPNKFPALTPAGDRKRDMAIGFFRFMDGLGQHEVLIETPNHEETIATMGQKQVEEIFLAYRERYLSLRDNKKIQMILIFKNHGFAAGTSVAHAHSQLIATPVTPSHIRHRIAGAMNYFDDNGECVYCTMIEKEKQEGSRIVMETENYLAFEPFASRSPFETLVVPKMHNSSFETTDPALIKECAYVVRQTLTKIHCGLNDPDYNYIILSAPCHERELEYYHWHIQILPRVTALAGFELGSGIYINPVIPEQAAKFLREIK